MLWSEHSGNRQSSDMCRLVGVPEVGGVLKYFCVFLDRNDFAFDIIQYIILVHTPLSHPDIQRW